MKNSILVSLFFMSLFSVICVTNVYSLEKPTHEAINEYVATNIINGFSLNNYILKSLGFEDGVGELIYGYSEVHNEYRYQTVSDWMGEGGIKEDEPSEKWRLYANWARNNNHFHMHVSNDIHYFSSWIGGAYL